MTEQIVRAADHAASQNDRWWVVVLFILLMFFVTMAGRWLVKKHEALIDQSRADQNHYTTQLADITRATTAVNQSLAVSLDRNTNALEGCSLELERCRKNRRHEH